MQCLICILCSERGDGFSLAIIGESQYDGGGGGIHLLSHLKYCFYLFIYFNIFDYVFSFVFLFSIYNSKINILYYLVEYFRA